MRDKVISVIFGDRIQFRLNLYRMASANIISQIIGISVLPVLSRLYSPESFGIFTSYTIIQAICLAVVTARFDWIIPNAKSDAHARRLLSAGMTVSLLGASLLIGLAFLFWSRIEAAAHFPPASGASLLPLLLIGLLAGSAQLLLQSWNVFKADLAPVSRAKLAQAFTTLILSLCLGLLAATGTSLVTAYVAGFVAAAAIQARAWRGTRRIAPLVRIRSTLRILRVYGKQLSSSVGLALINAVMNMSLMLLLVAFYDSRTVGWYGLIFRIATAPIGLITGAVVQSFWADAAQLERKDPAELRRFYLGSVLRLTLLALPLSTVFLMGPFYIPVLLGRETWGGAGPLLAAVTPYLFGMIVFSPTTHLIVYRKAHWQFWIDLAALVASAAVFAALARSGEEAWVAILGSSVVMLMGYLVRFALHLKANRQSISRIQKSPPL